MLGVARAVLARLMVTGVAALVLGLLPRLLLAVLGPMVLAVRRAMLLMLAGLRPGLRRGRGRDHEGDGRDKDLLHCCFLWMRPSAARAHGPY